MRRFLIAAVVIAAAVTTFSPAAFAVSIGDFLSIGQPNYYGRLDIDGYPRPQVLYRYPRAIGNVPRNRAPVYLRVPPGHAKNWKKHCRQYNACNERVLFVNNNWYNREYAPRYQRYQSIGQPNYYGRLNVDGYPRPQVLYRSPRAIGNVPRNRAPVYLRVPKSHAKNWKKHCSQYNACNERALFVGNNWYNLKYAPRYQAQQRNRGNVRRGKHQGGNGKNQGHGRKH